MDWTRNFQRSIDYIEENLTEELSVDRIAREMNISAFYYQKIFTIICGFSVGEYIRGRRLANAGSELAFTNVKIIDIALKYGYDTPEGFTRAFTKFHGSTPSAVRSGAPIKSFARLSVTVSMKGGEIMNYRIEKTEAFKVLEKREVHSISENRNNQTIPEFWERAHKDGTIERLLGAASDKADVYGICYANPHKDESTFDYSIAVRYDGSLPVPEGFTVSEIPARTWAVFPCTGAMPEAIQELWHKICTEFFPSSSYEPTYELDIEVYGEGDMTSDDYRSEIRVPVKTDK